MPLSWIETNRSRHNVNILVWRTLWILLMSLRGLLALIIRLSGLQCIYDILSCIITTNFQNFISDHSIVFFKVLIVLSQSALVHQRLHHLLSGLASWLLEQPLYKFLFIVMYILIINSSEW